MPLDPNVELFLQTVQQAGRPPLRDVGMQEARQGIVLMHALCTPPGDVARFEERAVPGPSGELPVRIYSPASEAVLPVVLYFHGGGGKIRALPHHRQGWRQLPLSTGLPVGKLA